MNIRNVFATVRIFVAGFRLQYPRQENFGRLTTRIFIAALVVMSVVLMWLSAAAQSTEPVSTYSRRFNPPTSLWYEGRLASALGLPEGWNCSGSNIQLGDYLVTTNGFLKYELGFYIDGRPTLANAKDGLLYKDEAAFSSNQGQVWTRELELMKSIVSCNTTAGPYFIATTEHPSWNPLGLPQFKPLLKAECAKFLSTSDPPDFKCAMELWWVILDHLMALAAARIHQGSAVMKGWEQQNVSSLRIFYNATDRPEGNTPANDYWYLSLGYTQQNDVDENIIDIPYLANGSVDLSRTSEDNFNKTKILLQPLASFVQSRTSSDVDVLKVLNALFVGYYWFILADLGHSNPTTYRSQFLVPSNFSQSDYHLSTNNVLMNSTLSESLLSGVGLNKSDQVSTALEAVGRSNGSSGNEPRFRRIYLCTERQQKQPVNLVVSVLGVGFSLIMAFCTCSIFLLMQFQGEDPAEPEQRNDVEAGGGNTGGPRVTEEPVATNIEGSGVTNTGGSGGSGISAPVTVPEEKNTTEVRTEGIAEEGDGYEIDGITLLRLGEDSRPE